MNLKIIPLFILLALASCQSSGGANLKDITSRVCQVWRGQHWAPTDNSLTISDAVSNNARRKVYCGTATALHMRLIHKYHFKQYEVDKNGGLWLLK